MKFTLALSLLLTAFVIASRRPVPPGPGSISYRFQSTADSDSSFRQFDFWRGKWVVLNAKGDTLGYNHIRSVSNGRALLEQWTSKEGVGGTSINYYNPLDGRWHQHWVGGRGMILHLSGKATADGMIMQGNRQTADGAVVDRIRWSPLEDGRVEQRWEIKNPPTSDWDTVFLGYYYPAGRE